MTKENFTQERLENYTNRLIQHMEEMTTNWQQGWMGATNQMIAGGFPTNLKGRQYNGMNALFLFFVSAEMGYKSQTWLTVKQANEAGYRIKKGEKGSDIFLCRVSADRERVPVFSRCLSCSFFIIVLLLLKNPCRYYGLSYRMLIYYVT